MSAGCDRVFVTMHDEPRTDFFAEPIAKFDHLFELVTGIDMKEWERQRSWIEGFARKMYQHARILADRIQQHRISKLCDSFAQNINGFAFKLAKMCPVVIHDFKLRAYAIRTLLNSIPTTNGRLACLHPVESLWCTARIRCWDSRGRAARCRERC